MATDAASKEMTVVAKLKLEAVTSESGCADVYLILLLPESNNLNILRPKIKKRKRKSVLIFD